MTETMIIEGIGYLGSVLVVVSMLMTSVLKLRVINTIGAGIFAGYALVIHSYPTALMNACLVLINLYNLARLLKTERHYDLIDGKADEAFLAYLLDYYKEDIKAWFPETPVNLREVDMACIVCTDAVPAGIFLGRRRDADTMEALLDYATPVYRDCSVGGYLYSKLPGKGVRRLAYAGTGERHIAYLRKMGFAEENGIFVKQL